MKTQNYIPHPISVDDVELSDEIKNLTEQIAKNVHEVWSESRIKDGWTWGPERNDELKRHPCLIPYENLTEEEKEYDRKTAMATLKLVLKLGFKIKRE